jgi:hypothetical protein
MSDYTIETQTLEEQPTAAMFATLTVDEIGGWLAKAFPTVGGYLARFGVGPVGMPYACYRQVGGDGAFEVEAGFAATTPVPGEGEVEPSELPGGTAAVTVHRGSYDTMGPAYEAITSWLAENGYVATASPWEVYLTDPDECPDPAEWRTQVVQPYAPA